MESYAPPPGPPPSDQVGHSGQSSNNHHYSPTNVPVPGQPLLRNGKMLVYPHGWRGCPKCHDTGYKYNDPSHPCRRCWQDYGQAFNPLLISSSSLNGAKVLQKPLPNNLPGRVGEPSMPGQFPPLSHSIHGNSGYPGTHSSHNTGTNPFLSPHSTGNSSVSPIHPHPTGNAHYHTSSPYQSPPQPPPSASNTQQDDRPSASREDDLNEDGEAPPAYELAVAAGPDGALPPQRVEVEQTHSHHYHPPRPSTDSPLRPLQNHVESQLQQQQHQQHQQFLAHQQGWPSSHSGMSAGMMPMTMPYGHRPPANALVVRPGDPRIGGQLCYKCGGQGSREGFWFGDVTICNLCNGSGRIMM